MEPMPSGDRRPTIAAANLSFAALQNNLTHEVRKGLFAGNRSDVKTNLRMPSVSGITDRSLPPRGAIVVLPLTYRFGGAGSGGAGPESPKPRRRVRANHKPSDAPHAQRELRVQRG
jgi:hypothetical protein